MNTKRAVRIAFIILVLSSLGQSRYNPKTHTALTKDQVYCFVKEAAAFIQIYGKQEALREFNDKNGLFVRGELYIHANDFNCKVLASGRDPKLKGTVIKKLVDPDKIAICADKVALLKKQHSGWLKHKHIHPLTGKIADKLTYFERVGNEDWYITSGMYFGDSD